MSFRTRATVASFFIFAVVSAARAQAPVQTSAQATAPPPDNEFYSLREPAAAGDAQAQFALANHYLLREELAQIENQNQFSAATPHSLTSSTLGWRRVDLTLVG